MIVTVLKPYQLFLVFAIKYWLDLLAAVIIGMKSIKEFSLIEIASIGDMLMTMTNDVGTLNLQIYSYSFMQYLGLTF